MGELDESKRILRHLKGISNLGLKYADKSEEIKCNMGESLGTNNKKEIFITSIILKVFNDVIYYRTKK